MTGDVVLVTATVAEAHDLRHGHDPVAGERAGRSRPATTPRTTHFPVWVFPSIGACGWSGLGYVGGGGSWINGAPSGSWGLLVAAPRAGPQLRRPATRTRTTAAPVPQSRPRAARAASTATASTSWATRAPGTSTRSSRTRSAGCRPVPSRSTAGGSATYTIGALEATSQSVVRREDPDDRNLPDAGHTGSSGGVARGSTPESPPESSNGGLIRLAPSSVGGADLLDMNFATAGNFDDAELDVGKAFTDPERRPDDHGALEDGVFAHRPGRLQHRRRPRRPSTRSRPAASSTRGTRTARTAVRRSPRARPARS